MQQEIADQKIYTASVAGICTLVCIRNKKCRKRKSCAVINRNLFWEKYTICFLNGFSPANRILHKRLHDKYVVKDYIYTNTEKKYKIAV